MERSTEPRPNRAVTKGSGFKRAAQSLLNTGKTDTRRTGIQPARPVASGGWTQIEKTLRQRNSLLEKKTDHSLPVSNMSPGSARLADSAVCPGFNNLNRSLS